MRLSWNEIRVRAAEFARSWSIAENERPETHSFYNDFFAIFGVQRRKVATFEEPVKKLGNKQGFIDLFWKGKLLVEQKSAGRSLIKAREQALEYFPGLRDDELPRYILLCDFRSFELIDLDTREEYSFGLSQLPDYVEVFGFIIGVEKKVFKDQDPVNVIAAELMGELHDVLKVSGYHGHPLERLLVRLVFCLFADDTGIFDELGMFETFLRERTREDGADLGPLLSQFFQVLNTPIDARQRNLDEDLARFPYINGQLFAESLPIPAFDAGMRSTLIAACEFSWEKISPAIFGALFQSVMSPKERRAKGAHYTTEKNIMKLIQPLFLDELTDEFFDLMQVKRGRRALLLAFQQKLAQINILDPACGCGNFLIIAYRELRLLELKVLHALYPDGQLDLEANLLSKVDVDQFYGLEIDEFPSLIAQTAMWMMDHIMNNRLSREFGQVFARIPLRAAAHIHGGPEKGDALNREWSDVIPFDLCTHIIGNPPFVGFVMRGVDQQSQANNLMKRLGAAGSRLDFVAAWFLKAAEYMQQSKATMAFVATNSITQGEQVAALWPALFHKWNLEIGFAHRTFAWGSDARGKAHVHVVIVGLMKRGMEPKQKRLFSYSTYRSEADETTHASLSPYLFDSSKLQDRHLVVSRSRAPGGEMPLLQVGTKPVDGGYLVLNAAERSTLITETKEIAKFIRPYMGTEEFLGGAERWLLTLASADASLLRSAPGVMKALKSVTRYRKGEIPPKTKPNAKLKKASKMSLKLADTPRKFHVTVIPSKSFLVVPEVSSEERRYIPIGWLKPPAVPSNKLLVTECAELYHFALITSAMHMAWTRYVGGRLESRLQYSSGINYNPFPWPSLVLRNKKKLAELAEAVISLRQKFSDQSLSELYDPVAMPLELSKAHAKIDLYVDKLYRAKVFEGDRDRVEHLFALYERDKAALLALASTPRKRAQRLQGAK